MANGSAPGPLCDEGPLICQDDGGTALTTPPLPGPIVGDLVRSWSTATKIEAALRRTFPRLPASAAGKVMDLLSPAALAALAAALALWAASHAVGVGEAIDVLLFVTGMIFIGFEAIDAVKHVTLFVRLAVGATTEHELDEAAEHLARAIAIIGVDVAIALLTHGAGKMWKGRYRPTVVEDPSLPAGQGATNKFGDIRYSPAGSGEDQALALYHEQVHSFLSPKLQFARTLRADVGISGYNNLELLKYLEEALAESYAQLRVNGIKGLPAGIRFPIENGYVTLSGVLQEAAIGAAIYIGTIVVGGLAVYVYVEAH
jgi:hypothetical protein